MSGVLATGPAPAAPAARQVIAMPPLKLLLVEDNPVNRKLVLLRKMGYAEVDVAMDGIETLEAVRNRVYDVLLMDVQMPNRDGLDATRRIRSEIEAARQPQIVAMTANAMMEDREACLSAGMDAYIAKPITPAQLTEALLHAAERMGMATPAQTRSSAQEDAEARATGIADQVLAGGGEMGALLRSIDWSQSPLGPVYTWPQSLRTALSIVLTQKHPMFLHWGRELIQFYNDASRPILGRDKHPAAMGQRARECWPDIWDTIGPMFEAAMERGESTMVERGLLCLYRNGYYEEAYFTHAYSPIRDESAGVGGVLVACSESTAEVISARRNEMLLELDEFLAATTAESFDRARLQQRLASSPKDLPFTLVYLFDANGATARRVCLTGLAPHDPAAPMQRHADDAIWPVFECLRTRRSLLRENLAGLPALSPGRSLRRGPCCCR